MIKIFVGGTTPYLAEVAKQYSSDAQIILPDTPLKLSSGCYYISLDDMIDLQMFYQFLNQADDIEFCDPPDGLWGNDTVCGNSRIHTLDTIKKIKFKKSYTNTSIPWSVAYIVDQRQVETKQLWIAGCSVSHGIGVSLDHKFGSIISSELNLPVSFLTAPGSSVPWASDQLIRSDIRSGDIIVWGLTVPSRYLEYKDHEVKHMLPWLLSTIQEDLDKKLLVNRLSSDDTVYQSLAAILRVKNFCQKINATLILLDIFRSFDHQLSKEINYIYIPTSDTGTDPYHPGPKTHKQYANAVMKKLAILNN